MAENETVDPSLLRDRGWTCSKLKARENQEIKNKQHAFKEAQLYRAGGFEGTAQSKEVIGNQQEQVARKISTLRRQVCGLQSK